MDATPHLLLVLGAIIADALFGDPVYRLHPVRLVGDCSAACERALFAAGLRGRVGGVLHWLLVVGATLAAWWLLRLLFARWHPWLAWTWDLFVAYSLLCSRDLLVQGRRVQAALEDIATARRRLQRLVSRDTAHLDRPAVVRATIESLAENLTDGVLTPLWALCLFGLPGLLLVKAVSTLDSMVGYPNARYRQFGWSAARSDDLVHWLPARLSVGLIATAALLLRLDAGGAVRGALRWHRVSSSPNSGWSEAACAGALRVRLVGPIRYRGRVVHHDYIGDPSWPADLEHGHLASALRLIGLATVIATLLGLALAAGDPFGLA